LQLAEPVVDPFDRWRPEDLVPAAAQPVDLSGQGFDPRLCERLAAASFADEVDEIRHPPLLGRELSLLQLERVRQVGPELGDFLLDALKDVRDLLGVRDSLLDGLENDLLGERPAHFSVDRERSCDRCNAELQPGEMTVLWAERARPVACVVAGPRRLDVPIPCRRTSFQLLQRNPAEQLWLLTMAAKREVDRQAVADDHS
jgi:hypothetical protein